MIYEEKAKTEFLIWNKKKLIVPVQLIDFQEEMELEEGKFYFLEEISTNSNQIKEKCTVGKLKLQKKLQDKYIFISQENYNQSKFEYFFQDTKKFIQPHDIKISESINSISCKKWISIINNQNLKLDELKQRKKIAKIKIKKNKCLTYPANNFIQIESYSKGTGITFNQLTNKIKICSNTIGSHIIKFTPLKNDIPFLINFISIPVLEKEKKDMHKSNNFKNFNRIYPGWQKSS